MVLPLLILGGLAALAGGIGGLGLAEGAKGLTKGIGAAIGGGAGYALGKGKVENIALGAVAGYVLSDLQFGGGASAPPASPYVPVPGYVPNLPIDSGDRMINAVVRTTSGGARIIRRDGLNYWVYWQSPPEKVGDIGIINQSDIIEVLQYGS